jgi:hypothetical protein
VWSVDEGQSIEDGKAAGGDAPSAHSATGTMGQDDLDRLGQRVRVEERAGRCRVELEGSVVAGLAAPGVDPLAGRTVVEDEGAETRRVSG